MRGLLINLCKALLSLFGVVAFSSCDILGVVCEYGTPHMDYTVMGKVVNAQEVGLKGIKVKPLSRNFSGYIDSTYTDASGNFTIGQSNVTGFGGEIKLIFEDEAGEYRTDTINVKLTRVKEGKGWDNGDFAAEDVKITMRQK